MLYLYYGSDHAQTAAKATALINDLLKRKPNASFFKLDDQNWSLGQLQGYIGSQSLFENRYIVLIQAISEPISEQLEEKLKEIGQSENIFVVRQGVLNVKKEILYKKYSKKAQKIDLKTNFKNAKKEYKIFALTDAVAGKKVQLAWVELQKARRANVSAEEIQAMLFWQIKSLLLSQKSSSASSAGLNPFVYNKASAALKNFKAGELEQISSVLVSLYHQSHRGLADFNIGLEQLILSL